MRDRRRPHGGAALVCALALAWVGCGDDGGVGVGGRPSAPGAIGGGERAECGVFGRACIAQGLDAPLALGSQLDVGVTFEIPGSSGTPIEIEAADEGVIVATGARLEAVGEGATALLFVGPDGSVLDFIHAWVAAPDELQARAYSRNGDLLGQVQPEIVMLEGDELLVAVEPFLTGQPMLGNFALERAVDGAAVAVVPDAVGGWYRVVAREAGQATVTFEALNLTRVLRVEVMP